MIELKIPFVDLKEEKILDDRGRVIYLCEGFLKMEANVLLSSLDDNLGIWNEENHKWSVCYRKEFITGTRIGNCLDSDVWKLTICISDGNEINLHFKTELEAQQIESSVLSWVFIK